MTVWRIRGGGGQDPLEMMLQKMCASVLREMQPHVVEAEQAAKQARAELRDRFAMSVVSGVYLHWRTSLDKIGLGCNFEDIAEMAYDVADAMLKARDMENEQ